jgi:hypothetical protein
MIGNAKGSLEAGETLQKRRKNLKSYSGKRKGPVFQPSLSPTPKFIALEARQATLPS